jgi:hypothetical protein
MRLSTWLFTLLVLIAATPARAQEEPLPAPPPDEPGRVQPPPQRQPQPQPPPQYPQQYPQQYPPGYQPPPPGYPPPQQPYYQPYPGYPGYPPPQVRLEPNRTAQRFSIYVELLGKLLFWGVGFDVNILPWLGMGVAGSYVRFFDWRVGMIAPYVSFYPAQNQKSALLIQAGPIIGVDNSGSVLLGDSYKGDTTWVWGQVTIAYEYRNHFLVRPGITVMISREIAFPWPGVSLGGSF